MQLPSGRYFVRSLWSDLSGATGSAGRYVEVRSGETLSLSHVRQRELRGAGGALLGVGMGAITVGAVLAILGVLADVVLGALASAVHASYEDPLPLIGGGMGIVGLGMTISGGIMLGAHDRLAVRHREGAIPTVAIASEHGGVVAGLVWRF